LQPIELEVLVMTAITRSPSFLAFSSFAALVILAGASGGSRVLHAQPPAKAPAGLTVVGCLAQLADSPSAPPTGHEQDAAKGLALTRVTVPPRDARGNAPRSAVPGSSPSGFGSGTTDGNSPRPTAAARDEQSFWIVGNKAPELLRLLGRRVEVTGPLDQRLAPNPGNQNVTDAGAAAARRAATAPDEPPTTAHPSAPTRAISVSTFRLLDGACS
jgi:hypothetical protein